MPKTKPDEILEVDVAEIPKLIEAVNASTLDAKHKEIILQLIGMLVDLKHSAQERAAALQRIGRMLGKKTEKQKKEKPPQGDAPPKKPRNHGRLSADDYKFSRVIDHAHHLPAGSVCPLCSHGTLQQLEARRMVRLIGQPAIVAELHRPERLRCSGCQEVITAQMPEEVGDEKADASANALVAVFRYGMGIPFYRLATMQQAMGVPLPASTQYEMVEMLWTQVTPIYKEMLAQAARWPLFFTDDTSARIMSLLKDKEQRKAEGERVGIFTTGIVARDGDKEIRLFFTGRKHAGENLADLLDRRIEEMPPPIQMSDALSRNVPKDHLTLLVLCLVHARRNFVDCQEAFPDEATYVIERIGRVYKNEQIARDQKMDDQRRLEFHRTMSGPIMAEIHEYAQRKLASREVEPNGILGGAFKYLVKHWDGLTQFVRVPGVPLDNNEVERLLKKAVLHRKNSLFYKTEDGARVGDVLMSIIQTAIAAGVNPFDYLTDLQKNARDVAKHPQRWLPWVYRANLDKADDSNTL